MDEKELVIRAKNGDIEAFEKLVELYKNRAFSLAFVRLRNREDARDIMQEVFIRIYYNLKRFDANKNFFSWFYKIEMNLLKNYYRHKKRIKENSSEERDEDFEFWVNDSISMEEKMTLWNAIEKLRDEEKDIVLLRYFENLDDSKIAETLGISPQNVRVKLFRIKQKLLEILEGGSYEQKRIDEHH